MNVSANQPVHFLTMEVYFEVSLDPTFNLFFDNAIFMHWSGLGKDPISL